MIGKKFELHFFLHLFILCVEVGGTHATVCVWRAKDSVDRAGCGGDLGLSGLVASAFTH